MCWYYMAGIDWWIRITCVLKPLHRICFSNGRRTLQKIWGVLLILEKNNFFLALIKSAAVSEDSSTHPDGVLRTDTIGRKFVPSWATSSELSTKYKSTISSYLELLLFWNFYQQFICCLLPSLPYQFPAVEGINAISLHVLWWGWGQGWVHPGVSRSWGAAL